MGERQPLGVGSYRCSRKRMSTQPLNVQTDARYIGMIGSKRKVIGVVRELEKEGIAIAEFERIFAPMGFDIGAITPEEIAVAVVAEMIAVRRNPDADWKRLSKSVYLNERLRAHLT